MRFLEHHFLFNLLVQAASKKMLVQDFFLGYWNSGEVFCVPHFNFEVLLWFHIDVAIMHGNIEHLN